MPYLSKEFRDECDEYCEESIWYTGGLREDQDWAGCINYLNYRMLFNRMKREDGKWKRYWKLALWVGTMMCCVLEVYRRVIGPYEDSAIKKNGDVE